jgi:hypothetical protein
MTTEAATDSTSAVAAATSIAVSNGLDVTEPKVLHVSNKISVLLQPCSTVARVAPVGENVAPFEIDLALKIAAAGGPVAAIEPRMPAEVFRHGDFDVTFWTYYESVGVAPAPIAYARSLERLHQALRTVDIPTPRFTDRIDEAEQLLEGDNLSGDLSPLERGLVLTTLRDGRRAIAAKRANEQILHGEPHPGNVLSASTGPMFIDLETCCRGPIEFDLAHVPVDVCDFYDGADRELVEHCRALVIAMVAAWRVDVNDRFPNRELALRRLVAALRHGPPWPTLDELTP